MSEFNEANWRDALLKVIVKATVDPTFRQTCLSDPAGAVSTVSDIELPADFHVHFVDSAGEMNYYFLLPPVAPAGDSDKSFEDWVNYCRVGPGTRIGPTTHPTIPF